MKTMLHYGGREYETSLDRYEFEVLMRDAIAREERYEVKGLLHTAIPLSPMGQLWIRVQPGIPIALVDDPQGRTM